MGRVPYVKAGTSAAVDALYKEIAGMGRPVLNLYRVLANQPPALAAFLEMSRYAGEGRALTPACASSRSWPLRMSWGRRTR